MRGVVKFKHGIGNVELREVNMPEIGLDEVLIKSKAAPIGSDVRVYKDDPVMRGGVKPPVVLGSENSGEIVEVGKNVTGWKPGDRVVHEMIVSSCGQCRFCRMGRPFRCPKVVVLGRGQNGSFADYFKAPAQFLHRIPDNVSFEQGAITEDLAVCVGVFDQNHIIRLEDTVAILGPGPMGLLSLQICKKCGAGRMIVSGLETDKMRLEIAQKLGADYIVQAERQNLEEFVKDLTKGEGVDVVVLATGVAPAINQAFNIIRKFGTMVVIGFPPESVKLPWQEVNRKTPAIFGTWGADRWEDWEKALRCISSGSINVEILVTHKFLLEQWEEAFNTFDSAKGIKVELIPEGF